MLLSQMQSLLLTEDRHFDVLKECPFPRIEVIGLDLFLQSLI